MGAESIQINEDRLNSVQCKVVDISGTKAGSVWETTLTSCLKYIAKWKILDLFCSIREFKDYYQAGSNFLKDENGDLQ